MLRLELKVTTWLLIAFVVTMMVINISVTGWAGVGLFHAFVAVASAFDRGLEAMRHCGFPCHPG